MVDRRLPLTGSAPAHAPQAISNPTPNLTSDIEDIGLVYDDNLYELYFPEFVGTTALPNSDSEFHDSGFCKPECHDLEPVAMAAQINAGFPHYTPLEHIQQPHPSLNIGLPIASSATGPPTNWSYGYKASPAPGQYNIGQSPSRGHFIPFSMTSSELLSFPVIPQYDITSLGKETRFVSCSNSAEMPSSSKSGPAYPNNPPQPGRRSQNIAEQPRRLQTNPRTRGLNKRSQNIQNLDPSEFYDSLPAPPPSWTSEEKEDEDKFTFEYNGYGELSARFRLSKRQMKAFLYQHPLHKEKGELEPRKGALTLWVQTVPADSNTRYSAFGSDKCRFAECPVRNNTIHKGFYRVAIDENHHSGIKVNPYYCAGFVHLYCLEKFLNFQDLCKHVNVQPDNRLLAEPKNKMALTRDHDELFEVAKDFIENSEHAPDWDFKRTLSHLLTEKHLLLEPRSRARKRLNLGGNHLSRHRGDLEAFVEGERLKFEGRKRTRDDKDKDGERGEPQTKKRRTDGSP